MNTVAASLNPKEPPVPYLINTTIVERTNHSSIFQALVDPLTLLWADGIHHGRVLLFVSDAAAYMEKASHSEKCEVSLNFDV